MKWAPWCQNIIIIIITIIINNDGGEGLRMPEIPLKTSRAIICKTARELRHNNFMGQGESVLCNFAERAPMPKGIENPEKEELRC